MPKTIKGPTSVYSRIFRRIVRQLETDARFRAACGDIRSWKGAPNDAAPMTPSAGKPIVRLTPRPQQGQWYSADTQTTSFVVHVEFAIASYAVEDVLDLWDLLEAALRPGNGTFAADLVALGADTGEVLFSDPAWDHRREDKGGAYWDAAGQCKLDVLRSVD